MGKKQEITPEQQEQYREALEAIARQAKREEPQDPEYLIGQLIPKDGISLRGLLTAVDQLMTHTAKQAESKQYASPDDRPLDKGYSRVEYSGWPGVSLEQRMASAISDNVMDPGTTNEQFGYESSFLYHKGTSFARELGAQQSSWSGEYVSFQDKDIQLTPKQARDLLCAFNSVDEAFHRALFPQGGGVDVDPPLFSAGAKITPQQHFGQLLKGAAEAHHGTETEATRLYALHQGLVTKKQALWGAAKQGNYDLVVELLIDYQKEAPHGAWKNFKDTLRKIEEYAEQRGDTAGVEKLLRCELEVLNARGRHGRSVLHLAAEGGYVGTVQALIQSGRHRVDEVGEYGQTPLQLAAGAGHDGVVGFLLEQGVANPNIADDMGQTALHKAASFGHQGIAYLLIGHGADLTLKDKIPDANTGQWIDAQEGMTAVDLAEYKGYFELAGYLRQEMEDLMEVQRQSYEEVEEALPFGRSGTASPVKALGGLSDGDMMELFPGAVEAVGPAPRDKGRYSEDQEAYRAAPLLRSSLVPSLLEGTYVDREGVQRNRADFWKGNPQVAGSLSSQLSQHSDLESAGDTPQDVAILGCDLRVERKQQSSRCRVLFRDDEGFCYKITDVHIPRQSVSSFVLSQPPAATLEETTRTWAHDMALAREEMQRTLGEIALIPEVKEREFSLRELREKGVINDVELRMICASHKDTTLESKMTLPGVKFIEGFHELTPEQVQHAISNKEDIQVDGAIISVAHIEKLVKQCGVEDILYHNRNIGYIVNDGCAQLVIVDFDPDQVLAGLEHHKAHQSKDLPYQEPSFRAVGPVGSSQSHIDRAARSMLENAQKVAMGLATSPGR